MASFLFGCQSRRLLSGLSVFILLFFGCQPSSKETVVPQEPPRETITLERANEMYVAYNDRFAALTEFRGGQEDARFGWHSIDFYKQYIAYLEAESAKVKMKVSGLRLYYVAYPEEDNSEQRGYQTYIFVPTYFDEQAKKHYAFDPLFMDENGKPLPIHEAITEGRIPPYSGSGKIGMLVSSLAAAPSSAANMGEMCKPNCP